MPARLAGGHSRAVLPQRAARPPRVGDARQRRRASASAAPSALFWERWSDFFDARAACAASDGRLRIVYVTEDTGVGGGHRDIFEHLNRLAARGHDVALYTLGEPPEWFELRVPVHSFDDYDELGDALAEVDAIKVATWWMTAAPVWRASIPRGIPVYFVQDIETSYYPDHERARHAVLDSYRPEFRYMTISSWNRERLRELGLDAELIPPGHRPGELPPAPRRRSAATDMVLALGRSNPLKNLPLTLAALARAARAAARSCACSGSSPSWPSETACATSSTPERRAGQRAVLPGDRVRPDLRPRGLRAAAAGGDGDGRRGRLHRRARQPRLLRGRRQLPDARAPTPAAVGAALARLLGDPELRARLGARRDRDGAGVRLGAAHRRAGGVLRARGRGGRMAVAGELAPELDRCALSCSALAALRRRAAPSGAVCGSTLASDKC